MSKINLNSDRIVKNIDIVGNIERELKKSFEYQWQCDSDLK